MALNVRMITLNYTKVSTNNLCEYYTVHSRNCYGYDHSLFLQLTNFSANLEQTHYLNTGLLLNCCSVPSAAI